MKRTWRQRLAWHLRCLADRIDGHHSLAFALRGITYNELCLALGIVLADLRKAALCAAEARRELEKLTAKS